MISITIYGQIINIEHQNKNIDKRLNKNKQVLNAPPFTPKFDFFSQLYLKKNLFFYLISERFWINAGFDFGAPCMNN